MPLFLSEEEFERCSHDASVVAEKADAYIRGLFTQLETVKAEADAASITAEQTCSLLEQKYVSLSTEFSSLQSKYTELSASLEERDSELAQLQVEKHQLHLLSIGKDGDIERLTIQVSELQKSKRELMELLEHKDLEISEKNSTMKSYLDKIVNLTDTAAVREARSSGLESELARSQASCARLSQEKELIERHNVWLNDELTAKVDSLIELRKKHSDLEAEFSAKLADVERKFNESSSSLKWNKERVKELESKLASLEEELLSSKASASSTEEGLCAEISTVTKLVDLYKESSGEWSKKAGELEGVIKALETHLNQTENDYKERLEKELSSRKEIEKEAVRLKEKLETCEAELESTRKENELKALPLSLSTEFGLGLVGSREIAEDDRMLVPSYAAGISGTALAASLIRDGWSLAKMYSKYQEAIDALRHEQLGRKQTQAILERVLHEIEEKSGVILDERVEHERLVEAYYALDGKLQHSLSEQATLERTIQELNADLKRLERDFAVSQKENIDLQKQVTVLLKECRDIQLRCGAVGHGLDDQISDAVISLNAESDSENILTDQLITFKDINGLVEQNVQLRSLVRHLSDEIGSKEKELKEIYEEELQKHTDEAVSKVNAVLARADEQGRMIESLHTSVAMYRKLYEEEHKLRSSYSQPQELATDDQRKDIMLLLEDSHENSRKAQQQAVERSKCLEEEMAKLRREIISVRSERDKLALEAQFAQEKLHRYMKEFEHQRDEHNGVISRNVEFSQLIVEYQKKLRENSESLNAAEELSRKLTMEVSVLKNEKEMLLNAEKRASDEVRILSERVYRLQASFDTIQSTEEVREEARIMERKKQEEYIKQIEREWAEAKKELQEEREIVRNLRIERENALKNSLKQVEEIGKELANALRAVSAAEARAAVAEARCNDLEKMRFLENKVVGKDSEIGSPSSADKAALALLTTNEEIERLRDEAKVNKDHMLQYKGIAEVNEVALKQMESAHENYKVEMDKLKKSLEEELQSLLRRVQELESECNLKTKEVASVTAGKEEALATALSEITILREDESVKLSQIAAMEVQISALKDDLEKEHQKWRTAQDNYERQVILQSETIQELTKTSHALAILQEEASDLRKLVDALKIDNNDLKAKWEVDKSALEVSKNEAERRFNEVNDLNKVLHSQLEAMHIKLAEKDCHSVGLPPGGSQKSSLDDDGMQSIVNYLRRSKEIAETEISLLKQEKLRLQSQLESALKAAESAQSSLHAERANVRSLLFTEEEFKSLQLQVREMNLLRESNAQLREENRHNFEECQKLREAAQKAMVDTENCEKLLRDRQNEVEACKKEIEILKIEKDSLNEKMDKLQETYKNIDADDYHRSRDVVHKLQEDLFQKDAQLEEIRKLVSDKQELLLQLEQDLGTSRVEVGERETRINELLQVEASLRSEVEKHRRLAAQFKKKSENLSKEKDDLNKEMQALAKQTEDAKQGKRSLVDTASEQAIREKEKEKDTRIQILERTVERQREELKKERDEHKTEKAKQLQTQKTISDSFENVTQQRSKLLDELEKHKQTVIALTGEIEKLKNAKCSQSEGVQLPSGAVLDDISGASLGAVDNFERVAQPVCIELGIHTAADQPSTIDKSSSGATTGQAVASLTSSMFSSIAPGPSITAGKTGEEKDKSSTVPKANVEPRKAGRKLVRPRILKPEEPQSDIEMSELDGPSNGGQPASTLCIEPQVPAARKRPPTSSPSELQEELLALEETSSIASTLSKKAKGSETPQEGEGQSAANLELHELSPEPEGSMNDVTDVAQGLKEESADANKDEVDNVANLPEETTIPGQNQADLIDDKMDVANESLDRPSDFVVSEQEIQQSGIEYGSEPEEGELTADVADPIEIPETAELLPEHAASQESPGGDEGPGVPSGADVKEVESSQDVDDGKKVEVVIAREVERTENIGDAREQVAAEPDQGLEPSAVSVARMSNNSGSETGVSRQRDGVTADTGGRQVSPIGRTINLSERAKERASIRQLGMLSTSTGRGRGRAPRGRAGRAARGGRGQPSGEQG